MNGLIDTVLCQLIWWPCLRCVLWSLEIFRLSSKVQALVGDSSYSCTLCPELPTQCTHGLGILTARVPSDASWPIWQRALRTS